MKQLSSHLSEQGGMKGQAGLRPGASRSSGAWSVRRPGSPTRAVSSCPRGHSLIGLQCPNVAPFSFDLLLPRKPGFNCVTLDHTVTVARSNDAF